MGTKQKKFVLLTALLLAIMLLIVILTLFNLNFNSLFYIFLKSIYPNIPMMPIYYYLQ